MQVFVEGKWQIVDDEQILVPFSLLLFFAEVEDELPEWRQTYISVNLAI